jgi:uncharacterized low-complexity protein
VEKMKKMNKTLVLAMGTTLISGLASAANVAEVQEGVFQMTELSSGYMQLATAETTTAKPKTMEGKCAGAKPMSAPKVTEAKCGEGKCGDAMLHKAATEGAKAPAETTKTAEGKCGDMKKTTPDASKKTSEATKPTTDTTAVKK